VIPLLQSYRQTTDPALARLLFICSPSDYGEQMALAQAGQEPLVVEWESGHADYARKIQAGFQATSEPWIFNAADDIAFHPQWAENALMIAERTGKRVIGTDDLGNPEVRRAKTATHLLIARSYIEERGTIDQRGQVFSEVYDHNYVDRELVSTAVFRDEWAFAKNSVVEHLHFHWGKGQTDSTYRKGLKNFNDDRRRYISRMKRAGLPLR
jgi:hypothetical protein